MSDPVRAAYAAGLAMLARRELSEARVRERLRRKEHGAEAIDAAVARLREAGAVDDRRVAVSAARTEVCYVTGEVKSAGAYPCDRETNVLKAVTLAGGFTDAAAKGKIRIVRQVDGREQVRERVGLEEPVLPNDVLVVPKSFF
jgi:protein involved in polysaccharide export with SLBB domain